MGNLLYDRQALEDADTLLICVPGALSGKDIFEPVSTWQEAGYGMVFYRFPGMDGRPVQPALNIAEAAREIADLVAGHPSKPVRLLGYSTGGPIVLTAATLMTGDIRIAAMSSAVEGGGGLRTGLMGLWDVVAAAGRKQSLSRHDVWVEYYRVLLFGRRVLSDEALAARADRLIAEHRPKIVMPDGGKPRAHTDDLRAWRLPENARFAPDRLHFFIGLEDPVFSRQQTLDFARKCGDVPVTGYPGQGHLLFLTGTEAFEDVRTFFEKGSEAQMHGIRVD